MLWERRKWSHGCYQWSVGSLQSRNYVIWKGISVEIFSVEVPYPRSHWRHAESEGNDLSMVNLQSNWVWTNGFVTDLFLFVCLLCFCLPFVFWFLCFFSLFDFFFFTWLLWDYFMQINLRTLSHVLSFQWPSYWKSMKYPISIAAQCWLSPKLFGLCPPQFWYPVKRLSSDHLQVPSFTWSESPIQASS